MYSPSKAHNVIIKICGVRHAEHIQPMAALGVNYVGIVFYPASPRFVTIAQAITLSAAAIDAGIKPVAIFVNQTAQEMQTICELTHIRCMQLHGHTARQEHHFLPKDYQRFYVLPIEEHGSALSAKELSTLDQDRDMILVDHVDAGKGKCFDWKHFQYNLPFPWLLAGGLTVANVDQALNLLKPNGVDVSSGVEDRHGKKNIKRIQSFIHAARGKYDNTD